MTNLSIEEIAGAHLGKTSDGSTMQRYETPTQIDPSLLVGIPRHLNRTDYGIEPTDFVGFDRWNAYEVSCLMKNGFPVSGKVVLQYDANTANIVESKSLKLYFNSLNMHRFETNNISELMGLVDYQIMHDLRSIGINATYVSFTPDFVKNPLEPHHAIRDLEHYEGLEKLWLESPYFSNKEFKFEGENPELLFTKYESSIAGQATQYAYHSSSLRSNCRVTNQPDWGDIYITFVTNVRELDPLSLYDYIISLRTESHFHEEICEVVYNRLRSALKPLELMVACHYTRRGGIDINPVRATTAPFLNANIKGPRYADILKEKRQ